MSFLIWHLRSTQCGVNWLSHHWGCWQTVTHTQDSRPCTPTDRSCVCVWLYVCVCGGEVAWVVWRVKHQAKSRTPLQNCRRAQNGNSRHSLCESFPIVDPSRKMSGRKTHKRRLWLYITSSWQPFIIGTNVRLWQRLGVLLFSTLCTHSLLPRAALTLHILRWGPPPATMSRRLG